MNSPKCLLTGAAGRIGSAFWRAQQERFNLRLADIDVSRLAESKLEVVGLDVTDLNSCLRACQGIETVIHLAADASPQAEFMSSLLRTNIVGTYNMFLAARDQGCRRIVFASSAQAVEGYPLDVQVHEGMPTRPANLYGVSKAFGEALASFFAHESKLTTVAVRIANFTELQAGAQNSARDVAAFISERDVVQLLARCVEADLSGFNVVHGVSDNRYKRLAIDHTRKILGYAPSDDAFAILEGMSGNPV